jgi:hypothetical protein
MRRFAMTNIKVDNYFEYLSKLDNKSKKMLIIKLTESLDIKDDGPIDLSSVFGAWEDTKDADEIIKQIRESRVDNRNREDLE